MLYVIKENENIYDVALKLYGDVTYVVKIINDNPIINLDTINIANIEIVYNELIKQKTTPIKFNIVSDLKPNYIVKKGQSIYDLAIIFGYGIEQVVQFSEIIGADNIEQNLENTIISVTKINTNLSPIKINIVSDLKPNYVVKKGQSIYDLALIFGYGIEGVVQFSQIINANNIEENLENKIIIVTKINTKLSNLIILENKILSTDISIFNGLLTNDGEPLLDDDNFWLNVN